MRAERCGQDGPSFSTIFNKISIYIFRVRLGNRRGEGREILGNYRSDKRRLKLL